MSFDIVNMNRSKTHRVDQAGGYLINENITICLIKTKTQGVLSTRLARVVRKAVNANPGLKVNQKF